MSQPSGESTNDTGKEDAKGAGAGDASDKGSGGEPKVYSQSDIDKLSKALREERKRGDLAERTMKDAELAKLPELEQAKAKAQELEVVNAKLTRENLQYKVGADLKLPTRFWKKISGDTEDEMRADAAEMVKDLKSEAMGEDLPKDKNDGRKPPANDGKKQGGSGKMDMNALIRAGFGKG